MDFRPTRGSLFSPMAAAARGDRRVGDRPRGSERPGLVSHQHEAASDRADAPHRWRVDRELGCRCLVRETTSESSAPDVERPLGRGGASNAKAVRSMRARSFVGVRCRLGETCQISKAHLDLRDYLRSNWGSLANYADARRMRLRISSAPAESNMHHIVNQRMGKRQPMRWSASGATYMLQVRCAVLDDRLAGYFRQWYPRFQVADPETEGHYI